MPKMRPLRAEAYILLSFLLLSAKEEPASKCKNQYLDLLR